MKVYVLKEYKRCDFLYGRWINKDVVATIDQAENYVEHDREYRDYDEFDLDLLSLSYNQIFGERNNK